MSGLRPALLSWYDRCARELPWRRTRDPYAIWVSEVMLQQTRVETVVRYYDRFLSRFPTARALAAATEDEVMSAWSGLGYYRRARLLHAGVREVVARYGARVPESAQDRRALPGVGRYTAGAIGSIAFDRAEPIVDGNVARVLSRLFAIDSPPGRAQTERELWAHAERLVKGPRPGAFNQALMELGATVCTKGAPHCARCPLEASCLARAQGRQRELPPARDKSPPRPVALVGILATRGRGAKRQIWLARGRGTLFGGLWNLPMREGAGRRAARGLAQEVGLDGDVEQRPLGSLKHVLSHRELRLELWAIPGAKARPCAEFAAFDLAGLEAVGTSRLTRKALELERARRAL